MMLKVNGEFLDFNEIVEVEKRVKLFEQIDETLGDFSYAFNLNRTAKNLRILGHPSPDGKDKRIYRTVECDLMDESGVVIYKGVLKVERITAAIECSFYSGNFNWIKSISGALADIDFSDLDTEINQGNIANSWDNTEGIIFPFFDAGGLITRSNNSMVVQDFSGCIFVKTIFKRIFTAAGIKTQGELFTDPVFNNLILARQNVGITELKDRSSFAAKSVGSQNVTTNHELITFENDSNFPFYDGSLDNYNALTSRFTADVKMKVTVRVSVSYSIASPPGIGHIVVLYKNGAIATTSSGPNFLFLYYPAGVKTVSFECTINLNAGDYLEIFANATAPPDITFMTGSTFKVTPTYIFYSSGNSLVPAWTKEQFVSNILALFCVISDFDPYTKTVTFNYFERIKDKEPVDISDHFNVIDEDYSEFISNFFQRSLLAYEESNDEQIEGYDNSKLVKYGAGEIIVNNDGIDRMGTILESEFKAPVSYINGAFAASTERTNFITMMTDGDQDFTAVVDNATNAQFTVADSSLYQVGDVVRVSESTDGSYNGDYVVQTVNTGWIILRGLAFSADATGVITRLEHRIGSDDGVYLFIATQYQVENVSKFSTHDDFLISDGSITNPYSNMSYAFFNILDLGLQINQDYKQGLSFGEVDNPQSYQRTMIDTYWGQVRRTLNDPVKILGVATLPKIVFGSITPLRPIRVKTEQTNNLYYCNRIGGYAESYLPCEVDLIKLS